MTEAFILDVGHGNCAVVLSAGQCVVIDAGHAPTLMDFLKERGIAAIDAFILSHADEDHIIGAQTVLGDEAVAVKAVYVNPDAEKETLLWGDVINALEERACSTGAHRLDLQVGHSGRPPFPVGPTSLEFLSPLVSAFLRGPGGRLEHGEGLTGNSNSMVVRLLEDFPRLIIAADITAEAWQRMNTFHGDVHAEVLVIPHHGGRVGPSDGDIQTILSDVTPKIAIVSNGRGGYNTPRPGIVLELQRAGCRIACTQLAVQCGTPGNIGVADPSLPSRGAAGTRCCAGSIRITLETTETLVRGMEAHAAFVDIISDSAMCRRSAQT